MKRIRRDHKFWGKATAAKFRSRVTEVDGISFASRKEARRYADLKIRLKAGEISDLRMQVEYPIEINGQKVCSYVADFVYRTKSGEEIVEDTKSDFTAKLPLYRLKKKLMLAVHGIRIVES